MGQLSSHGAVARRQGIMMVGLRHISLKLVQLLPLFVFDWFSEALVLDFQMVDNKVCPQLLPIYTDAWLIADMKTPNTPSLISNTKLRCPYKIAPDMTGSYMRSHIYSLINKKAGLGRYGQTYQRPYVRRPALYTRWYYFKGGLAMQTLIWQI
jgi:hypothetical protein